MKTYYRYYPSCTYHLLDNWLNKKSKKGQFLEDYGLVKYVFREGTPQEKVYFTYSDITGNLSYGYRFCVTYYHPAPDKNYGKLVSSKKVHDKSIILVDPKKINKEYYEMKHRRNMLYTIRSIIDFLRIVGGTTLLIFLWSYVK